MKRISKISLAALILLLVTTGCSTTSLKGDNQTLETAPRWVIEREHEDQLSTLGYIKLGTSGFNHARVLATTSAKDELARILSSKVVHVVKSFTNSSGISSPSAIENVSLLVSREITEEVLRGSKQKDLWISPQNELYVLVGIDKKYAVEMVKEKVSTSFKHETALWQELQNKKAYRELQIEIDRELGADKEN